MKRENILIIVEHETTTGWKYTFVNGEMVNFSQKRLTISQLTNSLFTDINGDDKLKQKILHSDNTQVVFFFQEYCGNCETALVRSKFDHRIFEEALHIIFNPAYGSFFDSMSPSDAVICYKCAQDLMKTMPFIRKALIK